MAETAIARHLSVATVRAQTLLILTEVGLVRDYPELDRAVQHSPSFGVRLLAYARLIHLFPNMMVLGATVVMIVVAALGRPPLDLAVRLFACIAFGHAAIGIFNDYCDAPHDALAQPYKPIPSGLIARRTAGILTLVLLAGCAALAATFTLPVFVLIVTATLSGLAYDLRFKNTLLSWLPYSLSFSLLPQIVWAAFGRYSLPLLWLFPLGLFLGIGLNLSNALPDIEADAHGLAFRGLAHRLGTAHAFRFAQLAFAVPTLLTFALVLLGVLPIPPIFFGCAALVALVAIGLAGLVYRLRPDTIGLRRAWALLGVPTIAVYTGFLVGLAL